MRTIKLAAHPDLACRQACGPRSGLQCSLANPDLACSAACGQSHTFAVPHLPQACWFAEFLQNARLTGEWSIHARYWPEEKPDAATVTPRRVVRLVQTILQVTEEYYELLGESICKTEESEDPRVQDKLEDWEDRHSGLDELAVYSQREGQRDDSLDSVLDTFENLSFELDV